MRLKREKEEQVLIDPLKGFDQPKNVSLNDLLSNY